MGNLSNYVTLTITQASVGLTRAGFGVLMILAIDATFSPERIRYYSDIDAVAEDFTDTSGSTYLAAAAAFAQSPAPTQIAIGRSVLKPTLVAQLSAVNPTSNVGYAYKVTVRGKGLADTEVTFTSDASPTDAEYAAGMVTALNAVASKNYTASGSSSPITITATSAGDWFSIEVANVATQKVKYTHADPGVATDLAAIKLENNGWYALATVANSKAYGVAAAGWVESAKKIYVCDSCDSESVTTAAGNADLLDTIATNAYARTLGFYHPSPANMAGTALLGKCLPYDPGTVTFFGKTLATVAPVNLSDTHRTNLVDRRATSYETVAGLNITFGGMVGDPVTGYLDVRRDLDALEDDMTKAVFGAIVASPKLPYDDNGIAIVANEVRGSLNRFVDAGMIARSPKFTITVPTAASVSTADKQARRLRNVKFAATFTGAIHSVDLAGTISV